MDNGTVQFKAGLGKGGYREKDGEKRWVYNSIHSALFGTETEALQWLFDRAQIDWTVSGTQRVEVWVTRQDYTGRYLEERVVLNAVRWRGNWKAGVT